MGWAGGIVKEAKSDCVAAHEIHVRANDFKVLEETGFLIPGQRVVEIVSSFVSRCPLLEQLLENAHRVDVRHTSGVKKELSLMAERQREIYYNIFYSFIRTHHDLAPNMLLGTRSAQIYLSRIILLMSSN